MAISSADGVLLRRSPQEPLMSLREPLARLLGTPMDDAAFLRLTISIARAGKPPCRRPDPQQRANVDQLFEAFYTTKLDRLEAWGLRWADQSSCPVEGAYGA